MNGKPTSRPTKSLFNELDLNEVGILVTEHGKSRYLENGIWTSLRSEFRNLKEILDETSDDESSNDNLRALTESLPPNGSRFLFGRPVSSTELHHLHPEPVEALKLWWTYFDNINPLIKPFHAPIVQQIIVMLESRMYQLVLSDISLYIVTEPPFVLGSLILY